MTLQEFQQNFACDFTGEIVANTSWVALTKVYRKSDGKLVDSVKTTFDIYETNTWISDSQTMGSLTQWDWNRVIDETKRQHLNYFALRAPITEFYPLDSTTDISLLIP